MTSGTAIAAALGVAAVLEDMRRRQLPDWLTAAGAAGGIGMRRLGRTARPGSCHRRRDPGISDSAALPSVRSDGRRRRQIDGRLRSLAGSFGDPAGGSVRSGYRRPFRSRQAAPESADACHPVCGGHCFRSLGQSAGWRFMMRFDRRFVLVVVGESGLGAAGRRSVLPVGRQCGRPQPRSCPKAGGSGHQAAGRGKYSGSRLRHTARRAREPVSRRRLLARGRRAGTAGDQLHTGGRAGGRSTHRGQRQRRGSGTLDCARNARHLGPRQRRGGRRRLRSAGHAGGCAGHRQAAPIAPKPRPRPCCKTSRSFPPDRRFRPMARASPSWPRW